jgi:hypothetical protein
MKYLGLLTYNGGGFQEVSAPDYKRVAFADDGSNVQFAAPKSNWGTIVALAVYNNLTGGDPENFSKVDLNKTINKDDPASTAIKVCTRDWPTQDPPDERARHTAEDISKFRAMLRYHES